MLLHLFSNVVVVLYGFRLASIAYNGLTTSTQRMRVDQRRRSAFLPEKFLRIANIIACFYQKRRKALP